MNVTGQVKVTDINGGAAILSSSDGIGVKAQGVANGVYATGQTAVSGKGTDTGVLGDGGDTGVHGTGVQVGVLGASLTSGIGGVGVIGNGGERGVEGNGRIVGVRGLGDTIGVEGYSGSGVGSFGHSENNDGVAGRSTNGRGVWGVTLSPNNGGVVGQVLSEHPVGSIAVVGECVFVSDGGCTGMLGITNSHGSGVVGKYQGPGPGGGDAVHGWAYPTSGPVNGVVGETASPEGAGVIGLNNSAGGQGVRGGATAFGTIGVLGYHNGGGIAIQSQGDMRVFGNIYLSGNVIGFSSRRLKTDIQPMHSALDQVKRLQGVTFNWKETGKHDVGLIAEDVAVVVPEVVGRDRDGVVQGVDYGRLTALLIEAVKEQQAEIEQLRAALQQLGVRPSEKR